VILLLLENGKKDQIKPYLEHLKMFYEQDPDYRSAYLVYKFTRAIIHKFSETMTDHVKAQALFQELMKEKNVKAYFAVMAIIHSCDLLLTELRTFGKQEVLDSIEELVNRLLTVSRERKSYNTHVQALLFKSQLAMINMDFNTTKELLSVAQKLAEEKGLSKLAIQVSKHHDELLEQFEKMESLVQDRASLIERISYTQINDIMKQMTQNRQQSPEETVQENPAMLIVLNENRVPVYTYRFLNDNEFKDKENQLLAKTVKTVTEVLKPSSNVKIERFKIEGSTVLLNIEQPLVFCYIFTGRSYTAQLKLEIFIDVLKSLFKGWNRLTREEQGVIQSAAIDKIVHELYERKEMDLEIDIADLPRELQKYKPILNPVRLALVKVLYNHYRMQAVELKDTLGISWGAFHNHIQALEKVGIIEARKQFVDTTPRVMVSISVKGSEQYLNLKKTLRFA